MVTDDTEKVTLQNNFFVSQTILDCRSTMLPDDMVQRNLDTTKAIGPDEIGNKPLKEAALPISKLLSELFSFCINLGVFPDVRKVAQVTPLLKKPSVMH